jgi:hypothetical protein
MSGIDLSLPDSVPDMAQHSDRPMTLDSFALYNLVDTETEPSDLIEECHAQCPRDDYVYFRKAPGITSLRRLIDFHLTTTVSDGFDPNLFLVVTDPNWQQKGLSIITLGDEDGKPDMFEIKAEDSGIVLINLQIGNTDWYEAKENYEFSGQDVKTDVSPGNLAYLHSTTDERDTDEKVEGTFTDAAVMKKPEIGFYIAIYSIPGIDPTTLLHSISPAGSQNAASEQICRFEGFLNPSRDLVSQAMDSSHPGTCMSNRWIHKMYFLIADSTEYGEKGLVLCGVKEKSTKRVECAEAVERVRGIVGGVRGWED